MILSSKHSCSIKFGLISSVFHFLNSFFHGFYKLEAQIMDHQILEIVQIAVPESIIYEMFEWNYGNKLAFP